MAEFLTKVSLQTKEPLGFKPCIVWPENYLKGAIAMMDLSDIETGLDTLNASVQMLTTGLVQLSGALQQQTNMLVHQTGLLTEIRALLTAEPEGESPLIATLRQLVEVIEAQSLTLGRIEASIAQQGMR